MTKNLRALLSEIALITNGNDLPVYVANAENNDELHSIEGFRTSVIDGEESLIIKLEYPYEQ